MIKKIIYGIALIVILVVGYLNYFADDKDIKKINPVVETSSVTYKNDDYEVHANKQKDFLNTKETNFEKATAKVRNMKLVGDNVKLDKDKNLTLNKNVVGSSGDWKFYTNNAKYTKSSDEITATNGAKAKNLIKKIEVGAKNFKTNSKISYIDLSDDVYLQNQKVKIYGDKGKYDDTKKTIIIYDNVGLAGVGKEKGNISGKFSKIIYNMNTKIARNVGKFSITYKGVTLMAEHMVINEELQTINIYGNVHARVGDFQIKLDNIYKFHKSNIINFVGKIIGKNDMYNFTANSGIYNTDTHILKIYGDIKGSSRTGDKFKTDTIYYNRDTNILTAVGDVNYTTRFGTLTTNRVSYDLKTKIMSSTSKYAFNGKKYESRGDKFVYDNVSKEVKLTNGYIVDKVKNQKLSANNLTYNRTNGDFSLLGNAYIETGKYYLTTQDIVFKDGVANILQKYILTVKKDNTKIYGDGGTYSKITNIFKGNGKILIKNRNYSASGEDLIYNSKTGLGKLGSNLIVKGKDFDISGENFNFKNGDYIKLSRNVKIKTSKFMGDTELARFSIKDNIIYLPKKININNKRFSGTLKSGKYYVADDVFVGNRFQGKSIDGKKIISREIKYITKNNTILLSGDVVVKDTKYILKDEQILYDIKKECIIFVDKFNLKYGEYTLTGKSGEYQNDIIKIKDPILLNNKGEKILANNGVGYLKKYFVDFTGNIRGKIKKDGVMTYLSGEDARVYLTNDNRDITRIELTKNAKFKRENTTLSARYMEIDYNKKIIYCKDNSQITRKDINGYSVIKAKNIEVYQNKNVMILRDRVNITNTNSKYGKTSVKARNGIIKKDILEVMGNVIVKNKDSTIKASKAVYNLKTKKIKASGNVSVESRGIK